MNVARRLIPSAAVAGALALGLAALTACSATDSDGRDGDGRLRVMASFYPMEFLAERIGGDHIRVTTLAKPGAEPHDLDISPKQTAQLSESGLVIYLKGLQPAVDEAIDQNGPEHIADAASYTPLEDHGAEVDGHDHGAESHGEGSEDHADEDHADEGHGDHAEDHDEPQGDHEGHDHGEDAGADPHVWLDPVKYAEVAKGVGKALEKADPKHAADYRANTAKLVEELHALDREFRTGLKNRTTDTFITAHAAFGYLAERYGLEQEAIAGLDPEAEPSPARMKKLHQVAEEDKVNTVFFETLASDKTAKTLAGDLGLKTDVLDPLESIADDSRGDDYFAVQRANLRALQGALGAQ
ncbi:metal ABC transporter substrate-binding protein [Streptomyces sp. SAJ15]|uniref:metal ABC transporter substrate-binding protein n=1 Tax=Streptomyces sp. SAJ15 TaxID=2011095 RepID=UPI0011858FB8|nr:metal ABC transporter substrate-binding protein [Streptomyces sp. SAJ15]TVL91924.1 zinc ABC transporter substrate-binding protein [Streptomyces sp. SAJ15]